MTKNQATPSAGVSAASEAQAAALAAFGTDEANLGEPAELYGDLKLNVVVDEPRYPQGPAPLPKSFKRVWIVLEENENIAPTGQFFGINGRSYILRPGDAAAVPEEVLALLDDAIESKPVLDSNSNVTGYRDKLRFPYRFVNAPALAA